MAQNADQEMAVQLQEEGELGPMDLTDEEEELAGDIKVAVALDPDIAPLSDFLYAQFAIFALAQEDPPTLAELVDRVQAFNAVKEECGVLDTYQDAMAFLTHFVRDLVPGYMLNCQLGGTSNSVIIDAGRFDLTLLGDDNFLNAWRGGIYYMSHACTKDFATIRHGVHFFQECEGFSAPTNLMFKLNPFKKWGELGAAYPMRFACFKMYHTNMFMNLMVSASKTLLPPSVHEHFQVGCEVDIDCGRLSEIFLVPNVEVASDKVMIAIQAALQERYDIERRFSLQVD